jgi:hypothetical protein
MLLATVSMGKVDVDDLLNASGSTGQNNHFVGHLCRLKDVVGHVDGSRTRLLPKPEEVSLEELTCSEINRRERFIQQKDGRIYDKRTGKSGPLTHSTRQSVRVSLRELSQFDAMERGRNPLPPFLLR